jgi:pSer/pThr/pTyr-binding forkhead associated (FHA) protein
METIMPYKIRITVLTVAILASSVVWAATKMTVRDILTKPNLVHEVAIVEGEIAQYEREGKVSTNFYTLSDSYRDELLVRTDKSNPTPGERYRVEGIVTRDGNRIYLSENSRSCLSCTQTSAASTLPWWRRSEVMVGGAVVVVVILGLIVALVRKSGGQQPAVSPTGTTAPVARSSAGARTQVLETSTMRIETAPGTMKALPGHFELRSGERRGETVQLTGYPSSVGDIVTIGRQLPSEKDRQYAHIQLKESTVSREQAKLVFQAGRYTLVNLGSTNPTEVNSRALGVDESCPLNDGDEVRLGEVVLRFVAPLEARR